MRQKLKGLPTKKLGKLKTITFFSQYLISKKRVPDNLVCGRPTTQFSQFIFGGQSTFRGAWPWLVAIQKQSGLTVKFLCGGSLISNVSFELTFNNGGAWNKRD
jgi:Trypsin